jgi:amidase
MEVVVPVSLIGLPSVAVPLPLSKGRPMGLQLIGQSRDDLGLLQLATGWHALNAA